MIISSSAITSNIQSTADKLGAPLPPAFLSAVTAARALPPGADEMTGSTEALHAAALAAMSAGKDPADDKTVQRLSIQHTLSLSGLRAAAEELAGDRITEALQAHADEIVGAWSAAVQKDLDTLTEAAKTLDLEDLDAAEPVLLKRSGVLNTWAEATSAAERVDVALAGMRGLLAALRIPHSYAIDGLLLTPDANLDTVRAIAAASNRGNLKAWPTTRAAGSASLRLATVAEFRSGTARLNAELQSREVESDAKEDEAKRTRSRSWQRVS